MTKPKKPKSKAAPKLDDSILWYDRFLPFLASNNGKTVAARKAQAEADIKMIFAAQERSENWKISRNGKASDGIVWISPSASGDSQNRFKLNVYIQPKRNTSGGPGNPPTQGPRQPPPSM